MSERTEADIVAELQEVERYLLATPPHSGAGARGSLLARRDRLQRELADARDRGDDRHRR